MYSISEGNRPHLALAKAFLGCIHLTVVADVLWHIAEVFVQSSLIKSQQSIISPFPAGGMLVPRKIVDVFDNICVIPWVASVCILTRR